MQIQATQITITTKAPRHSRDDLTLADAAALFHFDEANRLHWIKAPRGKKRGETLAGCEIRRAGVVIGRIVKVDGVIYRQAHIEHLLEHGRWPEARRGRKKSTAHRARRKSPAATTVVMDEAFALAQTLPAPIAPPELPEVSRAVVAAAKPAHRGWLAGLGLNLSRARAA